MFYCNKCATNRDWPSSIFKSYGACEICNEVTECSDVPSSYLPMPKIMPTYVGRHRKDSLVNE